MQSDDSRRALASFGGNSPGGSFPRDMMQKIAENIFRWELRHPDWHPRTEFGAKVACYVVHEGKDTVLVDPLFEDPKTLDDYIQGEVVVAVTIPYHVRSSADAVKRWGGTIVGHPDVQRRLPEGTPFHGDEDLPLNLRMHKVTRLKERPLGFPLARSLCFGDRVVGVEGGLRVWLDNPITDKRREWFHRIGAPAMEHLLQIDFDHALVTHGEPVRHSGHQALQDALEGEPWYHRPT